MIKIELLKSLNSCGGPAFPVSVDVGDAIFESAGMSMRDYFAAAALPALITHYASSDKDEDYITAIAYDIADAMLKRRGK